MTPRGRAVDERLRLDGHTPGRWAALTFAATLDDLDPECDAHTAVAGLSAALVDGQHRLGIDPEERGWPATAQAVVFSAARREIWRVGDTLVGVNGIALAENPTPLDGPAVAFRSAVLWAMLAEGVPHGELQANDPTFAMLMPLLERQHHLRNHPDPANPFAYGIIDGRNVHPTRILVEAVSPGDEVVFASDGYLTPAPTLAEAERELSECLSEDPLLIRRHLGFRPVAPPAVSFDDRAYLRFEA